MDEQLASIMKTLSNIKTTQNKLIQSFNEQEILIKNINNCFEDVSNQIKDILDDNAELNYKVSQLKIKINNLEKNLQNASLTSETTYIKINEIADRQSRANNIILFNLPEPTNAHASINDNDQLKLILNKMELNIEPISLFRLGNPSTRARPLKITFNNIKNVLDILQAQSKLRSSDEFKKLRFSSDRTIKQREQMSFLRRELYTRLSNGERNIKIKYVKGNPVIINNSKD